LKKLGNFNVGAQTRLDQFLVSLLEQKSGPGSSLVRKKSGGYSAAVALAIINALGKSANKRRRIIWKAN